MKDAPWNFKQEAIKEGMRSLISEKSCFCFDIFPLFFSSLVCNTYISAFFSAHFSSAIPLLILFLFYYLEFFLLLSSDPFIKIFIFVKISSSQNSSPPLHPFLKFYLNIFLYAGAFLPRFDVWFLHNQE